MKNPHAITPVCQNQSESKLKQTENKNSVNVFEARVKNTKWKKSFGRGETFQNSAHVPNVLCPFVHFKSKWGQHGKKGGGEGGSYRWPGLVALPTYCLFVRFIANKSEFICNNKRIKMFNKYLHSQRRTHTRLKVGNIYCMASRAICMSDNVCVYACVCVWVSVYGHLADAITLGAYHATFAWTYSLWTTLRDAHFCYALNGHSTPPPPRTPYPIPHHLSTLFHCLGYTWIHCTLDMSLQHALNKKSEQMFEVGFEFICKDLSTGLLVSEIFGL